LDVFSRYVVGWTVQHRETGPIAEQLIGQTLDKQQINRDQLTIHADRGSSMTSKPVAFLLADLGVTKTHSRPYTSTDNPYSEAHFKTLKYRPGFPDRFASIEHARAFCREFFAWYNHDHRHSGIGLMTLATVHHGLAEQTQAARRNVLDAAYAATPERFVRRAPRPPALPTAAWINKPDTNARNQRPPLDKRLPISALLLRDGPQHQKPFGRSGVNTLAPFDAELAEERVLGWQTKLHRWAGEDENKRFGDLFNLLCDPRRRTSEPEHLGIVRSRTGQKCTATSRAMHYRGELPTETSGDPALGV
jgi:hypothetical protein